MRFHGGQRTLTYVLHFLEVVIEGPQIVKVFSPFIEPVGEFITLKAFDEILTHSLAIRLRMATSFSTPRSSNVCGVNASFRRTVLQIGHGAGPSVNNRSMQDSHLQYEVSISSNETKAVKHTFYGNRN